MTTERLLTVDEVSDWLSVATRKIVDMAREQELPAYKIGREWRFSREELLTYLRSQRNQTEGGTQHA